ncbi:hypothetical protein Swit_3171 [Rhizorhabdus wittichii RW1]|uniref:Uncharacterized protein n=1 Tax=Rhizorhabdus wittichii (strain DSM 6014 / CCUG 31198 / JCM 15750 / NBRC 105917 / EY 4224 / RW1) TaxID=392499 RepID=A0A9J9HDR9_RHIWR|nr:hypothetical protein Swit_3171 [Rhizorhabdus wittichii RW1]
MEQWRASSIKRIGAVLPHARQREGADRKRDEQQEDELLLAEDAMLAEAVESEGRRGEQHRAQRAMPRERDVRRRCLRRRPPHEASSPNSTLWRGGPVHRRKHGAPPPRARRSPGAGRGRLACGKQAVLFAAERQTNVFGR